MLRIPTNWMSYSYMVGTAWMFGDSVVWMVFWNLWIMAPSFFPWSTLWKAMRFYIGTPERSTSRLSHANPRCIWWQWRHKQRLFSTSSWKVHQANSVGMVKASQRSQLHGCSRTVTTRRRKDLPRQCQLAKRNPSYHWQRRDKLWSFHCGHKQWAPGQPRKWTQEIQESAGKLWKLPGSGKQLFFNFWLGVPRPRQRRHLRFVRWT